MLLFEYRQHDQQRFRVWSREDAAYGAFQILTLDQLRLVIRSCTLMGGLCRPSRDAYINQIDMAGYRPEDNLSEQQIRNEQLGST